MRCPHPISLTNCGVLSALCAAYDPDQLPSACSNTGCAFGQISIHGKCATYDSATGRMVTEDESASGICQPSAQHTDADCAARTRRGKASCEAEVDDIQQCEWSVKDSATDRAGDVALAIILPLVIVVLVVAVLAAWYIRGRLRSHDSQFTALQSLYEPLREELEEQQHGSSNRQPLVPGNSMSPRGAVFNEA